MGLTTDGETTCLSAGCINTQNRNVTMIIVKFIYSGLNSLLAVIFAIVLFRYNKKRILTNLSTKKANIMAVIAIFSEILFSVLPNFFVILVINVSKRRINLYIFNF
jgi:hypothetical protein